MSSRNIKVTLIYDIQTPLMIYLLWTRRDCTWFCIPSKYGISRDQRSFWRRLWPNGRVVQENTHTSIIRVFKVLSAVHICPDSWTIFIILSLGIRRQRNTSSSFTTIRLHESYIAFIISFAIQIQKLRSYIPKSWMRVNFVHLRFRRRKIVLNTLQQIIAFQKIQMATFEL